MLWTTPPATITLDEFVGGLRSPGAGFVGLDRFGWFFFPGVQDALDKGPGSLHFVATGEERRVAQHTVEQETLIGFWLLAEAGGAVEEIHVDGANLHLRAGNFRAEFEGDAFIWLDAQG